MLRIQAVEPELLAGLKYLMELPMLANYRLVGGTALALQFGHRKSVDIDLFGDNELDAEQLKYHLEQFGKTEVIATNNSIKTYLLNGVKLDFVKYTYPWLEQALTVENIRMATPIDIAAMKINAIVGRGVKKDFIDLNLLLDTMSLTDMVAHYKKKYTQDSILMVVKSLSYFDDAEQNEDPEMLTPHNWPAIKQRIVAEVKKVVF